MLMDKLAGTIFKATTAGERTVKLAEPVIDPSLAVIEIVPIAFATAIPPAFTLATADPDEIHVADPVRF